jgi:hypothetical protein
MNTGKSWKTTSAGLLMIAGAIVGIVFAYINKTLTEGVVMSAITAIVGGVGLMTAKDSNITGGTTVSVNNDPSAVQASQKPTV